MATLPTGFAEALNKAHQAGVRIIRNSHDEFQHPPEPFEIVHAVERHRWFWRPARVGVVLVAESHVYTSAEDCNQSLDTAMLKPFGRPNSSLPPDSFVRLVYCLGYGETGLLKDAPGDFNNPGTPRYWDIFGRLTGRGAQPKPERADFATRLAWKIDTLRAMCRCGIWLLDASVHAIYLRHGRRLPDAVKAELHRQWWQHYGKRVLESCSGAKVWVIGKTVFNCLQCLAGWRCRGWVYQPNYDTTTNWPRLMVDCAEKPAILTQDGTAFGK
ncbi:MAG TPA: hypothetical protein VJA21_01270 [Verrucomicrobiae bacterium]